MRTPQSMAEILEGAEQLARKFGLPPGLGRAVATGILAEDAPDSSPGMSWQPGDPDSDEGGVGDRPLPFGYDHLKEVSTVHLLMGQDGTPPKIVRRFHRHDQVGLEQLGNENLTQTVRQLAQLSKDLGRWENQREQLTGELPAIESRLNYAPLLANRIRTAFPSQDLAGQNVDIVLDSETGCYKLVVNGARRGEVGVNQEFGAEILSQKRAIAADKAALADKRQQADKLGRQIQDGQRTFDLLLAKVINLCDQMDRDQLKAKLDGNFVGFALNEELQAVAVVCRQGVEELRELPADVKQELLARHVAGHPIPPELQEALGLKEAVAILDRATKRALQPPKTQPQLKASTTPPAKPGKPAAKPKTP